MLKNIFKKGWINIVQIPIAEIPVSEKVEAN
jgi:hypothetical protein